MKAWIWVPVLIIVGGIGALYYSQSLTAPLVVTGFVEAEEIRVGSRVGGRVQEVLVEEGQRVKGGEALLQLEPYNLKELLAQAQGERAAAMAQRDKLQAGFRPEEIAAAKALYEQAKATYEKALAGPRKQEITEAEDALRLADANLELSDTELKRARSLFETKSTSKEALDRALTERRVDQASADVAKARLDMLREGTRAEEIAETKAALARADADLQLKQNGFRKEEIAEAAARVEAAEAAVQSIQTQIAELVVAAPCDAVVEAIDLQPGDLIAPNAPVLSLMDVRRMWVRAYVPENRLGMAQPGVELAIRVDGFPDRMFRGRVSFMSRQAEFTPSNVQTPEERSKQVFRIKVDLLEGLDLLRPGMAADVFLAEPAP